MDVHVIGKQISCDCSIKDRNILSKEWFYRSANSSRFKVLRL